MSLANVQGKLSRAELKNVMAGSGATNCETFTCYSNSDCTTEKCGTRCFSYNGKNVCIYW